MKKNTLIITLIMSLLLATPALATSSTTSTASTTKGAKTEKWQEIKNKIEEKKEVQKEKQEEKREEKREQVRANFSNQTVVVRGDLVQIKGISLPTELVVKVLEAKPEKKSSTSTTSTVPAVNQNITVKVDEKTNFVRKFWGHNSIEELTVGDKVMVVAKINTDGTYQGQMVKDESIYFKQKFLAGTVSTTSSSSVNIKVGDKDMVVKVNDDTKIIKSGVTSTTLANLVVGDKILVKGVYNTQNDSVLARVIKTVKEKIWSLFGKK